MSDKNEPAFPTEGSMNLNPGSVRYGDFSLYGGLTKRELLAALALQGIVHDLGPTAAVAAQYAVSYADALLLELEKQR